MLFIDFKNGGLIMTIYTAREYNNVYDGGQQAVDRGDYRSAYDHFMACLKYKKRYESWNETEISHLEYLVKQCNAMFNK